MRLLFAVVVLFLLFVPAVSIQGAGDKGQRQNETLEDKETVLMENPASAGSLLEQRLTENVRVTDGLLFVKDVDALDLFILPANTQWTIECGLAGFSITFGNLVTG